MSTKSLFLFSISVVLIFFMLGFTSGAATFLTESFDGSWVGNAPSGWSYGGTGAYYARNTGGSYHYPCGYPYPYAGAAMAFFNAYNFYYTTAWMDSPTFNIPVSSTRGTVSFWMYRGSGGSTYLRVDVSSDNGANWASLSTLTSGNCGWSRQYVAIPSTYWSATMKIRLYAYADWYYDFSIDELLIDDTPIPLCIPSHNAFDLGGIINVSMNNLGWSTPGNYGYFDYRGIAPNVNLNSGLTYNLTVSTEWSGTNYTQLVYAYIDWNKNNILNDPGEEYYVGNLYYNGATATISITVPITVTSGLTTMRIRDMNSYVGPCGLQYGETEDYYVNLITSPVPKIELSPTAFTFTSEAGGPIPSAQNLLIKNVGANVPMNWSSITSATPTPNWLNAGPPTSGVIPNVSTTQTIPVQPNRTNLAASMPMTTYTGLVRISSPDANNSPQDAIVTYNVIPQTKIDIGASQIVIKATDKKPQPQPKIVTVTNTGGHYGGGIMMWSVTTSTSWLSFVGATSGSEGQTFTLRANTTGMCVGTYTGTVTIAAYNSATGIPASNSPIVVPVRLEIEPATNLVVTQNATTPGTYAFNNALGHRIMDLIVNSGNAGSVRMEMYPAQIPMGIPRLRLAWRIFLLTLSGTTYNVNLALYYTDSELALGGVTNPSILTGWRQNSFGGAYTDMGGTSEVFFNRVNVGPLTNAAGRWIVASYWYPKTVSFADFRVTQQGASSARVSWNTPLLMNEDGFLVQRSPVGQEAWETIAEAQNNSSGKYSVTDENLASGSYQYQVIGYLNDGSPIQSQIGVLNIGPIPTALMLSQNYPNPLSISTGASTMIDFAVPSHSSVTLAVYDVLGKQVASIIDAKEYGAGNHSVSFDASTLESGTYVYRLTANGVTVSKKLTIMK